MEIPILILWDFSTLCIVGDSGDGNKARLKKGALLIRQI